MQSLRYGLGDYECHACAANFALKCLYSSNHRNVEIFGRYFFFLHTALVLDRSDQKLQETPCLLDVELFHLLTSLVLGLPMLYCDDDDSARMPSGGLNEQHVLQLVFTAHVVQIMLTMVVCPQGLLRSHLENDNEVAVLAFYFFQSSFSRIRDPSLRTWFCVCFQNQWRLKLTSQAQSWKCFQKCDRWQSEQTVHQIRWC